MIDTSSEENIQDFKMTLVENKEVIDYNKSKKYSDWSGETLRSYKDKEKIEDEIGIISSIANEKKLMSRLYLKYMISAESSVFISLDLLMIPFFFLCY